MSTLKTSSARLQHIFPGLPKNCSENTTRKSDLLGTTRRRQGHNRSVLEVKGQDVAKSVHQKNLLNQRRVSIN